MALSRVAVLQKWLETAKPPKWLWRTIAAVVLGGQVATRILKGKQTPHMS